ncbi:flagellin N-terminal helical domain-containing protein [Pseudomonas huanghezhanensis]|uniref:flagellin N-terminal helical domain-containing protein n=1 Tax=Pseudomonas huanghezhanensis TaxID=3002903 RepID=UPI0022863A23|nr:flagellin [Pseudomonas sp. BSw22131]
MALTVNTNIASLSVQRNLNKSSDALSTSMSRLSSGLRINSAKDDAAGMQIATRLDTQIRGMTVATRNAGAAISIIQTAEGALEKSLSNLQRMRELAVQATNGNNGPNERIALNAEFQQSVAELTRIARGTTFGAELNLLDGSAGALSFQVGANVGATEKISLSLSDDFSSESMFVADADAAAIPADATTSGSRVVVKGEYLAMSIDGAGVRNIVSSVTDVMKDAVTAAEADLKTAETTFAAITTPPTDLEKQALATAKAALATAEKVVKDAGDSDEVLNRSARHENIEATMKAIDKALSLVNAARADLGAKQNRFTSAIENLQNMVKNATASQGQIQDVDFAAETAELTKQQTLQQASTAVLAQANQLPAAVLKLLQ